MRQSNQKKIVCVTVEDLVRVTGSRWYDNSRFELVCRTSNEFDDASAGAAWYAAPAATRPDCYYRPDDGLNHGYRLRNGIATCVKCAAYIVASAAHRAARPPEHRTETWTLETGNGDVIHVDTELAALVAGAWRTETKYGYARRAGRSSSASLVRSSFFSPLTGTWRTETKYGYARRAGRLTLAGILKRLGQTDVGDRVKRTREHFADQDARRRRNHHRKQAYDVLREAVAALSRLGARGTLADAVHNFLLSGALDHEPTDDVAARFPTFALPPAPVEDDDQYTRGAPVSVAAVASDATTHAADCFGSCCHVS